MSNGAASRDSQDTSDVSGNSVLNFTGAAISIAKERSRNGLTGDVSEPGGAPDIVLPHQDAQFVQHIAMDIGGSLIKLVYFTSGDDEDGASSDALGSEEFESSHACPGHSSHHPQGAQTTAQVSQATQAQHVQQTYAQAQNIPQHRAPFLASPKSLSTQNRANSAHSSAQGGSALAQGLADVIEHSEDVSTSAHHPEGSRRAYEALVLDSSAHAQGNNDPRTVGAVNSTQSLHSHPITALDPRSYELLPEASNSNSTMPCVAPSPQIDPLEGSGNPGELLESSMDAFQRDSMSSSSEKGRQGGRLHFVKFESARIHDAIDFIEQKQLHCRRTGRSSTDGPLFQVRATGGGAFKFADLFRERLGVVLKKQDEIACLVQGTNFLLRAIRNEAFEFNAGEYDFKRSPDLQPLYPYLLVNIGSGVSFVKVDGEGVFERVSGTNLGGGTFWGLCRLLTRVRSFDEMLELSSRGDSRKVDMLVGDIYGGKDYASIGLSADTIASSFGKVVSQEKELEDYNPADIALALCRMVSYNIGHLAFLNAKRYGISRLFFGGFFIRGHPYTMDVISYAIRFWSKGEMHACFLRHEGFLGAMGAFLEGHPQLASGVATGGDRAARHSYGDIASGGVANAAPEGLQARFVERFVMGSPFSGGTINGPAFTSLREKVSWVEKFVQVGAAATEAAREEHEKACVSMLNDKSMELLGQNSPNASGAASELGSTALMTNAMSTEGGEKVPYPSATSRVAAGGTGSAHACQFSVSSSAQHDIVGASETDTVASTAHQSTEGSSMMHACAASQVSTGANAASAGTGVPRTGGSAPALKIGVLQFSPSLRPFPLLADPATYNPNTYDLHDPEEREYWLSVLAKTVPNVVQKACMAAGERSSVRRRAKAMGTAMSAHFERLKKQPEAYGWMGLAEVFEMREESLREFRFYDIHANDKHRENKSALHVLGDLLSELDSMKPRDRLLSLIQGVLAANIFDWGAQACVDLYHDGTILDIYQKARRDIGQRPWRVDDFDELEKAWFAREGEAVNTWGRFPSPFRKVMLFVDNAGADAVLGMLPLARELLCMGADVVLVANSYPAINDITASELTHVVDAFAAPVCGVIAAARAAATAHARNRVSSGGVSGSGTGGLPDASRTSLLLDSVCGSSSAGGGAVTEEAAAGAAGAAADAACTGPCTGTDAGGLCSSGGFAAAAASPPDTGVGAGGGSPPHGPTSGGSSSQAGPRLQILGSGSGGPCLDLRRISAEVAAASRNVDLVIIEGMGRSVHTNLYAKLKCPTLKLAMIKTQRVAERLFNGNLFDCMCRYDIPGTTD